MILIPPAAVGSQQSQKFVYVGQPPAPVGQTFQYTINTLGRLPDIAAFERIIIKTGANEEIVRLKSEGRWPTR